jgi:hypothetical protein
LKSQIAISRKAQSRTEKKGPVRAPEWKVSKLLVVAFGIGWENDEAAVNGEGFEFDAEAETFLVRESCTNFRPAFAGFAVALVLLDGEDVEVGGQTVPAMAPV